MTSLPNNPTVWIIFFVIANAVAQLRADGPADNQPDSVRPVPPPGIEVAPEIREELELEIRSVRNAQRELASGQDLPLIEVLPRAVEMTLKTQMFYKEADLQNARLLLAIARDRIAKTSPLLDENPTGQTPAAMRRLLCVGQKQVGDSLLAVGGFVSQLDNSVQPYGLVIPRGFHESQTPMRLDVWLHGRGERVSEVEFLTQRLNRVGEYAPSDTIVLHPYGRYSNAFKFAGEIDVLEAIEHVKTLFPIDEKRINIRGFSMGGAGCWQFAVHYPDLFATANPGAGFCETTEFLRFFQDEEIEPTWFQAQLLNWYDCPPWTNNLRHVPTIAYSGEVDKQKQAADLMSNAFAARDMQLPHVIGPNTAHKIHEDSKVEIAAWLDARMASEEDSVLQKVDFTTFSTRYHQLAWIRVEGLVQHWQAARVQASLALNAAQLKTNNVSRLSLEIPGNNYFQSNTKIVITLDEQHFELRSEGDGSLAADFARTTGAAWKLAAGNAPTLRKKPYLQGPIDDAFMGPFIFVGPQDVESPTGVELWAENEFKRAKSEWQRHFRGDNLEARATEVSDQDVRDRNLVLFGTPRSNPIIAKIADQLPILWNEESAPTLVCNQKEYDAATHAPVLIFPNPLNPKRYVVLNSGFTFREYAYLNNARQIPMLPDWAIIDTRSPPTSQLPGAIVDAGFFNETWQWAETAKKR